MNMKPNLEMDKLSDHILKVKWSPNKLNKDKLKKLLEDKCIKMMSKRDKINMIKYKWFKERIVILWQKNKLSQFKKEDKIQLWIN